jgi:hypothetical protein
LGPVRAPGLDLRFLVAGPGFEPGKTVVGDFTDPPRKHRDLRRIPMSPPNGNTLGTGWSLDARGRPVPAKGQVLVTIAGNHSRILPLERDPGSRVRPPGRRPHSGTIPDHPSPKPVSDARSGPVSAAYSALDHVGIWAAEVNRSIPASNAPCPTTTSRSVACTPSLDRDGSVGPIDSDHTE